MMSVTRGAWGAYRVRRWTEFAWRDDKNRDESVARAAALFERQLREQCPHLDAKVEMIHMRGRPQIVFEGTVYGSTEDQAMKRACVYFEESLSTRTREGRKVKLRPPWGKVTAEKIDHG